MKREDIIERVLRSDGVAVHPGATPVLDAFVDLYEATHLFDRSVGPIGAARDRITTLLRECNDVA